MTIKTPNYAVLSEPPLYVISRNNVALKTPLGHNLAVPTQALADAIVGELTAQGEKADIRKMPLMQMALTTLDVSRTKRCDIIDGLMRYGRTELICQRATDPQTLVQEQDKVWTPYVMWCKETFGADLCTGSGIVPFDQNPEAITALRSFIETLDDYVLTGLNEACGTLGSLVLGLALMKERADVSSVFDAAELDNLWQIKQWGDDPVVQGRFDSIRCDLALCSRWFSLLKV